MGGWIREEMDSAQVQSQDSDRRVTSLRRGLFSWRIPLFVEGEGAF